MTKIDICTRLPYSNDVQVRYSGYNTPSLSHINPHSAESLVNAKFKVQYWNEFITFFN